MTRSIGALATQGPLAWGGLAVISLAVAGLIGWSYQTSQEQQRLSLLQAEAQRTSLLVIAQTLNSELMGAVGTLGLLNTDVKLEANTAEFAKNAEVLNSLTILGSAFAAEGVYVVGSNGIVRSAWDRRGTTADDLDVSFRSYFQMAMRGKASVFAAVSLRWGERSLYLAAPIFPEYYRSSAGVGALVARTNLKQIDALLVGRSDAALLLSPQGVVFASNKANWVGLLDRQPDAQRLADIRKLKQFGKLLDVGSPAVLPWSSEEGLFTVEGRSLAVASAAVPWNDSAGAWRLVLTEDLARTAPLRHAVLWASLGGLCCFVLGGLLLTTLRSQLAQALAARRLQQHARAQEEHATYRSSLMETTTRMQRCVTLAELAQVFLQDARALVGALQGCVYVIDPEQSGRLLLASAAACAAPPDDSLLVGEGLLGQCVVERHTRVIELPPDGFWTLRSGLGDMEPQALLLAPLLLQDKVVGALELAVVQSPDARVLARFEELVVLLATHLEILRGNLQTSGTARSASELSGNFA